MYLSEELFYELMGGMNIMSTPKYDSNVIYNQLTDFGKAFSQYEILSGLPESDNQKEAYKAGFIEDSEMIKYCESKTKLAHAQAVESNKPQYVDCVGLLPCQHPNEDCSWDIVEIWVTPEGIEQYYRRHMY